MTIAAYILIVIGCFFAFAGTIGILRMPDPFCRMQSSTNIGTLGALGIVLGGAVYALGSGAEDRVTMGVKIILIGLLIILTNPIAGHAICKAAYKYGIRPEKKMVCDEYGRENPDE